MGLNQLASSIEDRIEHRSREFPGECILLTGMKGSDQRFSGCQLNFQTVSEIGPAWGTVHVDQAPYLVECELPQRYDRLGLAQQL